MQGVFACSTSDVEDSISAPDQRIDMAPHRFSLQSTGR
jgi:hypothetical protein